LPTNGKRRQLVCVAKTGNTKTVPKVIPKTVPKVMPKTVPKVMPKPNLLSLTPQPSKSVIGGYGPAPKTPAASVTDGTFTVRGQQKAVLVNGQAVPFDGGAFTVRGQQKAVADDVLRARTRTAKNEADDAVKARNHPEGNKSTAESKGSEPPAKRYRKRDGDRDAEGEQEEQRTPGGSDDKEKAFMQRCPEVDLTPVPRALRPSFMERYEKLRPELEGNDVIMLCDDEDITLIRKANYRIENLKRVDLDNGKHFTVVRIIDGGKQLHKDVCRNFCNAFISAFLANTKGN
jgi:hypothetical protein